MSAWLAALRMARREIKRAKGRSALVIAMIALPVAGLSFAAIAYDLFEISSATQATRAIGSADARLDWVSNSPIDQDTIGSAEGRPDRSKQDVLALLPAGSKVVPDLTGTLAMKTASGIGSVEVEVTDLADPILQGRATILEGTAPNQPSEIALTRQAANWLATGIGEKVKSAAPEREYTVTGIVEFPGQLTRLAVLAPSADLAATIAPGTWLVDLPGGAPDADLIAQLNLKGINVFYPGIHGERDPLDIAAETIGLGLIFTTLAVAEIMLITGPAFAVGARRRARELALIAAAGGEPKQLRRIILADGVVLGFAGAVSGIALALATIAVSKPFIEDFMLYRTDGWSFFPLALVAIAVVAVGTGLLSALIPAIVAARQSVISVLSGRRGITRSRKRWIGLGLVICAVGGAAALGGAFIISEEVLVAGLVLLEGGLVILTPSLIGLIAKLGRWLPLTPRLALRDISRNRSSAAPAVSAVMAAVAGAAGIGMFFWSMETAQAASQPPALPLGHVSVDDRGSDTPGDWRLAEKLLLQAFPGAEIRPVRQPACIGEAKGKCTIMAVLPEERRCPFVRRVDASKEELRAASRDPRCAGNPYVPGFSLGGSFGSIVDGGSGLEVLAGITGDQLAQARQVLSAGGAIVARPELVKDGLVRLTDSADKTITVPGMAIEGLPTRANAIISPKVLFAFSFGERTSGLIAKPINPPTEQDEEYLRALLAEQPGVGDRPAFVSYVQREDPYSARLDGFFFTLAAGIIALAAAGIATGLTTADARPAVATLGAIGAPPALRRRLTLSSAGVIAGLGSVLGVITGLSMTATIILMVNRFDALNIIWPLPEPMRLGLYWETVTVVLAVPVIAMTAAALFTRTRLPIEQRS